MILIVTICAQAIFLVVARMAWDPLVGVDLFDMGRGILVEGGRVGGVVAGAVVLCRHDGQRKEKESGMRVGWSAIKDPEARVDVEKTRGGENCSRGGHRIDVVVFGTARCTRAIASDWD